MLASLRRPLLGLATKSLKPLERQFSQTAKLASSSTLIQQHLVNQSLTTVSQKRGVQGHHIPRPSSSISWKVEKPDLDFSSIGGALEVKESLNDIVQYFKNPKSFRQFGIKPPKGVILSGPPGTGKTTIANMLAGEANVKLIHAGGSQLSDQLVGGTERNLEDIFSAAERASPCVLLIDEIDSLGGKRFDNVTTANQQHLNSIVNMLLFLLSKIPEGVVVVATTNKYSSLDPALVRPGRFDRHIEVPLPSLEDRKQILLIHLENKMKNAGLDLDYLAAQSNGYSGAKLEAWVNEAALRAFRNKDNQLTLKHFDKAKDILEFGAAGREKTNETHKHQVASHEAGHALIAHLLGKKVEKISILTYGAIKGYVRFAASESPDIKSKKDALDDICIQLGGRAGELTVGIEMIGSASDLEGARELSHVMVHNEGMGSSLQGLAYHQDIEIILQEQLARGKKLLQENKKLFRVLVDSLVKRQELNQQEFQSIMDGNLSYAYPSTSMLPFWRPKDCSDKTTKVEAQAEAKTLAHPAKPRK